MPLRKGKSVLTQARSTALSRRKTHYVTTKVMRKIRPEKGGYGVFATRPISAGELLVVWGGYIVMGDELSELPATVQRHSIQVEENLYLVPHELPEVGDFINHSCNPNAGLSGQMSLVAIAPIAKGEEICYDYAMSDGSTYDEFHCSCLARECRGWVTGGDWSLPELQGRYAGYFSPYLQRRIDDMHDRTKPGLSMVPGLPAEVEIEAEAEVEA